MPFESIVLCGCEVDNLIATLELLVGQLLLQIKLQMFILNTQKLLINLKKKNTKCPIVFKCSMKFTVDSDKAYMVATYCVSYQYLVIDASFELMKLKCVLLRAHFG